MRAGGLKGAEGEGISFISYVIRAERNNISPGRNSFSESEGLYRMGLGHE